MILRTPLRFQRKLPGSGKDRFALPSVASYSVDVRRVLHVLAWFGLLPLVGCQECCSDHDCAANGDGLEFCVDGSCVEGHPALRASEGCDGDGDCDAPQICVQSACAFAPDCLRLQRSFQARLNQDATLGIVEATTSGCVVTFTYQFPSTGLASSATVARIERDGTFTQAVGLRDGTGEFNPASRVGSFGVAADDVIVFGSDSFACLVNEDCAEQIFARCRDGICQ